MLSRNSKMSTAATPPDARQSPTKKIAANGEDASPGKAVKKESFKWSTPADEFAEDVASDADEDDEDEGDYRDDDDSPIAAEIDGEQYEAHRTADGGIVIHLGVEEADRFAVEGMKAAKMKGETNEEIQEFVESYEKEAKKRKGEKKQKFQCPKCDKVWNWPWELRRHVLTHYKEKEREQTSTFKCEDCGRGFQWKRDLAQHMRLHTGEKLLVCSVCEKKFTTRQALLHHVVVHTGEKPFQCALCGNRFTQPANLRTHMKKKHNETGIKGNKCPHCQEPFPSIISVHQHILEDHQNIVAEEREEQTLEKMKKEQLKAEREHTREENRRKRMERRKDKIDYNDFKSQGLQEWEINYEFHIGEGLVRGVDWDRTPSNGELNCDICDRKFGWRYEVMFHNLCHKTDEHGNTKNRVCPECDTAFKVPIGLKHHLLLHTGELPFLCLHCWRSFSSHIDLKLHIRKEHLSHLEPQPKSTPTPKKAPKAKTESAKRAAKKPKMESQEMHMQQVTFLHQDGTTSTTLPDNVQLMVANQQNEHGENQTILLGSDGSIVQTGDQDMIVVIQSDDFDQSQGLIVVDPSQLQHMVGADGMPVTLVDASDTMILGQGGETKVILRTSTAEGDTLTIPTTSTVSVSADGRLIITESQGELEENAEEEVDANGEEGTMIVSDSVEDVAPAEGAGLSAEADEVENVGEKEVQETKANIVTKEANDEQDVAGETI